MSGRRRNRSERASLAAPGVVEGPSDAELARRLGNADGAALSELYQRFGRSGYSLARRICADDGLAEDVVHEVFRTLWRDPWRFDPVRGSFATWLLALIHQEAVGTVRRTSTVRRRSVAAPEADEERSPAPVAGAEQACADQAATVRVAAGQVHAALARLPGEQREVLEAAYFGGRTVVEIAACTGLPLGTVTSRMVAGVQRLRSLLPEQLGPDALIAEARAVGEMSR